MAQGGRYYTYSLTEALYDDLREAQRDIKKMEQEVADAADAKQKATGAVNDRLKRTWWS